MTHARKKALEKFARAILTGWKRGFLPGGFVFSVLGILLAQGTGDPTEMKTCYEMPAPPGPRVMDFVATPNPTGGADTVRLTATLFNYFGGRTTAGAAIMVGGPYLDRVGMSPADGKFDSDTERVFYDLDVSGYPPGTLEIYLVGWDDQGEESEPYSLDLIVEE